MTKLARYWLAIVFVLASFAVAIYFHPRLPARVPVHWSSHGTVDGWMPRGPGAFTLPIVSTVLLALMILLEPATVREEGHRSLGAVYPFLVATTSAFLLYATLIVLLAGIGMPLDVPAALTVGIGILFMVMGNSAPKLTRNSFVGIRSPWTLANEEVWWRTHRLAGWLLVLSGGVTVILGFLGYGGLVALTAVLVACAVCYLYSYIVWRRVRAGPQAS